jgi:hypothetical protein
MEDANANYFDLLMNWNVLDELDEGTTENIFDDVGNTAEFRRTIPPPQIPPSTSNTVPCFLKGTKILTTKGEINIEDLETTDKLINHLGKKCNMVKIVKFKRYKNKNTNPYVILKDTKINNYICNRDLYLSKDHAILINNRYFIQARYLHFAKQITNLQCEQYEYYHIITENFLTDTIISNGIPTESFGYNLPKDIIPYIYKNKVRIIQHKKEHTHNHDVSLIEEQSSKINYQFKRGKRQTYTASGINKIQYQ